MVQLVSMWKATTSSARIGAREMLFDISLAQQRSWYLRILYFAPGKREAQFGSGSDLRKISS